jgi:hypothetical protein
VSDLPESAREPYHAWAERVTAVVDEAHTENLGGQHCEGFCVACASAYLVAQRAVPGGPGETPVSPAVEEPERAQDLVLPIDKGPGKGEGFINVSEVFRRASRAEAEAARLRAEVETLNEQLDDVRVSMEVLRQGHVAAWDEMERLTKLLREARGALAGSPSQETK